MVKLRNPFRKVEVSHAQGYRELQKESDVGHTSPLISYSWTDKQPHPVNMTKYDDWANDPEASVAFNVLSDIIAGVGIHTEMPEGSSPDHKNKKIIDDYVQKVNLQEDLHEATMTMLQKGFVPLERLEDYDLKLLPPETFYIWKTKLGHIYRFTQEKPEGNVIALWEDPNWKRELEACKESYDSTSKGWKEAWGFSPPRDMKPAPLEDIIVFYHRRTPTWPYGKALTEPIGDLLANRNQMNKDMPKAIHRWAYPIPFVFTSGSKTAIEEECVNRDVDEWVFTGNVDKDEVWFETLSIDPQARFIPYIELIYYQIAEGLHAPLLLYLKNATEASATVMMESVDRLVNGVQNHIKYRVQKYLFQPQVGEKDCPIMRWGQPKTGLEDVTFTELSSILPFLPRNQQQELIKKYVPELPEPEWDKDPQPIVPQPFQNSNQKPQPADGQLEKWVDKINDMNTGLKVIEQNFAEGRLGITEACRMADKTITVHMKRIHGEAWAAHRDGEFQQFVADKLLRVSKKSYTVTSG